MDDDIPNSIKTQYKMVVSKLKKGYLTLDNYESKVINTVDMPLEINKWYIIDVSGDKTFNLDANAMYLEIIYVLEGNLSTSVNVYYKDIGGGGGYKVEIMNDDPLYYCKQYGIKECSYIPLEINDNNRFINWLDRNPMEVKE